MASMNEMSKNPMSNVNAKTLISLVVVVKDLKVLSDSKDEVVKLVFFFSFFVICHCNVG